MKLIKIFLFIVSCILFTQIADAQLFGWGRSGYSQTQNGYVYKGREYVRGRDLPDNPNCRCPMCRDLVSAYYSAKKSSNEIEIESASTKLIGTPSEMVPKLVDAFQIEKKSDFVLLDPGCGDARILINAAKRYGIRCIGIEINKDTYEIALENIKKEGLSNLITVYNEDSRNYPFKDVDGVVMFLFPDLINDMMKKFDELKPGARVVSYSHDIPLKDTIICGDIYVWTNKK